LNVATLCAHRHAAGEAAGKDAVVYDGDDGQRRALTFAFWRDSERYLGR
jgi:acetyl-CoA synthetase